MLLERWTGWSQRILSPESVLPVLLALLVSVALVVTLPQAYSNWEGTREVMGEQDFGLRLLRELGVSIVVLYCLLLRRYWDILLNPAVVSSIAVVGAYVIFEVMYALERNLPLVVPLAGLRVFEYLPLLFTGIMMARMPQGEQAFRRLAHYVCLFVLIEGVLGVIQALYSPHLYGVSLLGGGRAFGTFVSPNAYGATLATCVLLFAMSNCARLRLWLFLCVIFIVLSGSRTAFVCTALVLFFIGLRSLAPWERVLTLLLTPFLLGGALWLGSSKIVSGRDIEGEGRLEAWADLLTNNVQSVWNLLFGWGLGLGSNTVTVLFGNDAFTGQFTSDSLYMYLLNGFGLIGLLAYLIALGWVWRRSHHPDKTLFILFLLLAGVPFNAWEMFPQNALLMLLLGYVVGYPQRDTARAPSGISRYSHYGNGAQPSVSPVTGAHPRHPLSPTMESRR
ncbi:MAG: O-antigen ligase domain-containing protein [Pseudomonadota bacterium]